MGATKIDIEWDVELEFGGKGYRIDCHIGHEYLGVDEEGCPFQIMPVVTIDSVSLLGDEVDVELDGEPLVRFLLVNGKRLRTDVYDRYCDHATAQWEAWVESERERRC